MSIEPVEDWLVVRKVVKKRVFFFENKKAQPIPVVFGGWCKGSQRIFDLDKF